MTNERVLKDALHAALTAALDLRGMSLDALAKELGRAPRTVRRWAVDGIPLDGYLEAAGLLQSEPMGLALLEAYGVPTSGAVTRRLASAYAAARNGYQRVFEEAGIKL